MDKKEDSFENYLASIIVDCCYQIHVGLGPGLLESVYEEILFRELTEKGLEVERQKLLPVIWKGKTLDLGFRIDLIVDNKVVIEIKSVLEMHPVYK